MSVYVCIFLRISLYLSLSLFISLYLYICYLSLSLLISLHLSLALFISLYFSLFLFVSLCFSVFLFIYLYVCFISLYFVYCSSRVFYCLSSFTSPLFLFFSYRVLSWIIVHYAGISGHLRGHPQNMEKRSWRRRPTNQHPSLCAASARTHSRRPLQKAKKVAKPPSPTTLKLHKLIYISLQANINWFILTYRQIYTDLY